MDQIVLDAEAGQLSAELVRRGIAARTRVHVLVELAEDNVLPMTHMIEEGGAFRWLSEEPDLYTDLDRRIVTIPAEKWAAFEAWANRPPQPIPALAELAASKPAWQD